MNHFRKHVPGFVDTDHYPEFDFSSTDELLRHPEVSRFTGHGFSHFAKSNDALIAAYQHGYEWWCVGFITHPGDVDLPKFDGGKYAVVMPDQTLACLNGKDVHFVSGNHLTARNGKSYEFVRPPPPS